jgi:D-alanine-D-alanine ligase
MDFRMRKDGSLFFLEANANPNLEQYEDFGRAAEHAGIAYDRLLERIMSLGLAYHAEWRDF